MSDLKKGCNKLVETINNTSVCLNDTIENCDFEDEDNIEELIDELDNLRHNFKSEITDLISQLNEKWEELQEVEDDEEEEQVTEEEKELKKQEKELEKSIKDLEG